MENKLINLEQPNCVICKSNNNEVVCTDYPGFVENSFFKIFKCHNCGSHFTVCQTGITELYDLIYSAETAYGYDRYYNYMHEVKRQKDPLSYLAYKESVYYPVYSYLKDKKNLKILEVGCGYGYITFAMRQAGFDAHGLDISSNAIQKAKENFGDYYYVNDINKFAGQNPAKFDLVIATELIEHLTDPNSFIEDCKRLLKSDGKIILTTPNKDYYNQNNIWMTDLPPVHISWIGEKGMKMLAENHKLKISFSDYSQYYSKEENRLIRYLRTRKEIPGKSSLTKDGKTIDKNLDKKKLFYKIAVFFLHRISFVRGASNYLHNTFIDKEAILGVILEK